MMITGMNHVGVSVADLDRSIAFYRDVLGMSVVVTGNFGDERYERVLGLKQTRGRAALMRLGNFQIELFEFAHPVPRAGDPNRPVCDHGITHFCLQVTDIHSEYERMKAAGVAFHCPPEEFSGEAFATYGRDPDGNVFELLEKTGQPNA
jgi:catechol 2,3-dioxygenase-like lactoylglutathione lyase family enzyme